MTEVPNTDRRALPPPRFGLRLMFALVAVVCVAAAIIGTFGYYGLMFVMLATVIGVAHIAGAAIGHRLRASGDAPIASPDGKPAPPARRRVAPNEFAPQTQLSRRRAPIITMALVTSAGAILGGVLGGGALAWLNWQQAETANLVFGFTAASIMGGLFGFSAGGFVHVLVGAYWEARRDRVHQAK